MKFLCLCMILSFSLFAGENDLKKDLKKLARKSSLITFEKTKDFDNNELLNHYLDNGTHKWVYHKDVLGESLAPYFAKDAWFPEFCDDLTKKNKIKKCYKKFDSLLDKQAHLLYVNGDYDSYDYKRLIILFEREDGKNYRLTLSIQDEPKRAGLDF
jgi:hypothetical protein